jgi:hypothetical protein
MIFSSFLLSKKKLFDQNFVVAFVMIVFGTHKKDVVFWWGSNIIILWSFLVYFRPSSSGDLHIVFDVISEAVPHIFVLVDGFAVVVICCCCLLFVVVVVVPPPVRK